MSAERQSPAQELAAGREGDRALAEPPPRAGKRCPQPGLIPLVPGTTQPRGGSARVRSPEARPCREPGRLRGHTHTCTLTPSASLLWGQAQGQGPEPGRLRARLQGHRGGGTVPPRLPPRLPPRPGKLKQIL